MALSGEVLIKCPSSSSSISMVSKSCTSSLLIVAANIFGVSTQQTSPSQLSPPLTGIYMAMQPGGRIVATAKPSPDNRPLIFIRNQCNGHMAPAFGRKYLVCFYCNKKSGIKYDGRITQWECGLCQSMNFLDENGYITDPPVATNLEAPNDLKYAIPQPYSPSSQASSQASESTFFCSTCLKNQHLYTASLSQYHVETDPKHPQYRELERKYYQYKMNLEKRYPQVCEDCEPKVLERLRQAGKTAKTDYLRRLLDKSRTRKSANRGNGTTLSGSLESMGKFLWYTGHTGQLLWHVTALAIAILHKYPMIFDFSLPSGILIPFSKLSEFSVAIPTPSTWARWSLVCSVVSIWWNPKFRHLNNGFMYHIKGFGDWYKYQVLLLAVRGVFYCSIGTGILADSLATPTLTAHVFLLGFITYLAFAAHASLKVDMTPLWAPTPTKLPHVRSSDSPNLGVDSMADALDQIAATSFQEDRQLSTPSPPSFDRYQRGNIGSGSDKMSPLPVMITSRFPSQTRRDPSQLDMNLPSTREIQQPLYQQNANLNLEEMDWAPSQSASHYSAFNPSRPIQQNIQALGQIQMAPQTSPFWYKVPPAPITPAQRRLNERNPSTLRASQAVTENFFNNTTRRKLAPGQSVESAPFSKSGNQEGVEFAQQKFFPPPPPSEAGNNLADLLTSVSLGPSQSEIPKKTEQNSRVRHFFQGLALFLGLVFWNQAFHKPSEYTRHVTLAVMIGCACVGARTILDNFIYLMAEKQTGIMHSLGACLGGFECAAAGYGVLEIVAGRGDCGSCGSHGTILVGGMMIYEIWLASFG